MDEPEMRDTLSAYMREKNISIADLAGDIGIPPRTLQRFVAGTSQLNKETTETIADFIDRLP
jgi:plasmid maintenance system antidote protein VapI